MADYAIHDTTLTGISNVIRKKDGTSALIDPADYADRINLMGMLEEKTVSGAIAHFDDGADTVPLKSLVANLPASLDGYSSVEVVHTGSNVWDEDYALGFWNASGEWYGNTQGYMSSKTHISVKPSTQYCFINGGNTSFYICYYDENKTFIRRDTLAYPSQRVITTPSNCYFVNFSTYSAYGTTYNNDISLNYPSTFTEYAPYNGEAYNIDIPNPNPNLRLTADVDEGMWTTNGTINPSSGGGFGRALTMAVSEKTSYDIYGLLDDLIVYLDSNKTMLSYERLSNTAMSLQNERKTTPANCAYIGLSALAFDVSSVSVKESFFVYGGSIEVISGEGSETWEKKVYTGADNEYWVLSKSGDVYRYYVINDNAKQPTGRGVVYSSIGQYSASGNEVGTCFTYYSSGINRVLIYYIPPQTIQTVEDFRVWLQSNNFDVVYEKATPESFSVSPIAIDSKVGANNIWNDAGDTEVTYRSQGTAYIYPNAEEASF